MKLLIFLSIAIALAPVAAAAQALPEAPIPQQADGASWSRVENLGRGDPIMVGRSRGGFPVPCLFSGATDNTLFCDSAYTGRGHDFNRADIDRIRRDDKRRNIRIVIVSFAAAGFIAFTAAPPNSGTPRIVNGAIGAAVGAFGGLLVSLPVALLVPGRTVYRHSH
jgi:hypothetical protein